MSLMDLTVPNQKLSTFQEIVDEAYSVVDQNYMLDLYEDSTYQRAASSVLDFLQVSQRDGKRNEKLETALKTLHGMIRAKVINEDPNLPISSGFQTVIRLEKAKKVDATFVMAVNDLIQGHRGNGSAEANQANAFCELATRDIGLRHIKDILEQGTQAVDATLSALEEEIKGFENGFPHGNEVNLDPLKFFPQGNNSMGA